MDVKGVEFRIHRRSALQRGFSTRDVASRHADHPGMVEQMRIARPGGERFHALGGGFGTRVASFS